jgi:hypothetical protein
MKPVTQVSEDVLFQNFHIQRMILTPTPTTEYHESAGNDYHK